MTDRDAIELLPQRYCQFLVWTYRKNLAAPPTDQPYGCWIPEKKGRVQDGGYVRVTLHRDDFHRAGVDQAAIARLIPKENGERNVYLHVVSFKARFGYVPDGVTRHVSHLCDQSACFLGLHLLDEAPIFNNKRKNCIRAVLLPEAIMIPAEVVVDGSAVTNKRRLVIVTCGHGETQDKCIIPTVFQDAEKYHLVYVPAAPPAAHLNSNNVPTTLGKGGHTKETRKTLWGTWKKAPIATEEKL